MPYLALFLAVLPLIAAIFLRRISLRSDAFFLFCMAQAIAYLYIAPIACLGEVAEDLTPHYSRLQFGLALCFMWPVTILYLTFRRRQRPGGSPVEVNFRRFSRLTMLSAVMTAGFFFVALERGLFFHWFGNENNLKMLLQLNTVEFGVYREYALMSPILLGVFAIALSFGVVSNRPHRLIIWLILATLGAVFIAWQGVNSRSQVIIAAFFMFAFPVMSGKGHLARGWKPKPVSLVAGAVLAWYLIGVALAARGQSAQGGGLTWSVVQSYWAPGADAPVNMSVARRLNGIDLMARIEAASDQDGLAWGSAWEIPAYVAIMQWVDREGVSHYKQTFESSPKKYLINRYTTLRAVDYPTCCLTDIYGNFGLLGCGIFAVLFAGVLVQVTNWLSWPAKGSRVLIAVIAAVTISAFEAEGFMLLFGWIRIAPALIPLFLMCPFVVKGRQPASRFSELPQAVHAS